MLNFRLTRLNYVSCNIYKKSKYRTIVLLEEVAFEKNRLSSLQTSYVPGKSNGENIADVVKFCHKCQMQSNKGNILFIDPKRAYDNINRNKLLA
jgi:hypothetical protein